MVARPSAPTTLAMPPAPIPLRAPARPERRTHQLPLQPAPIIGRDAELAALRARLLDPAVRLLTLTGAPGTGKTRLAIAVAAEVAAEFGDGVWFVGLESVREPDQVVAAIAQALGVREAAGQPLAGTVVAHLADRQLLLVLDNFEQILPAAAQVAAILAGCPDLNVLVTSRAPLRLRWEHEVPVAPLSLPDVARESDPESVVQAPAVQLFLARARAVLPEFRVTSENAAALAAICVRLDGLPLAIELVAARVKLLSLDAILSRLEHRLALLTSGARDLPDRHRTLRAALAWSYDLLAPEERSAFRRLAVFAGGCTLEAAEAVADAWESSVSQSTPQFLDVLDALLGQSLLWREQPTSGEPRLRLLETVREFALERLEAHDELEPAARRHAGYFLALAEAAEPHLTGAKQAEWLARLEAEHDNLRAALAWSLAQGDAELGLRLARATARFWSRRGHLSEGRRWLERALAAGGAAPVRRRAPALQAAATLAWSQADYPAARAFTEESLALQQELGDKREIAVSLNTLGTIAVRQSDYATGRARFTEALTLVRGLGDTWRTAVALHNLGAVALEEGDYATARSHYEESLALRRGLGDQEGIAGSLDALGNLATAQGDYAAARAACAEGLALRRTLGDPRTIAYSLWNLALAARYQRDTAAAWALIEESLTLRRELGDKHGIAQSLIVLGVVAQDQGAYAAARASLEEALALSQEVGFRVGIATCLLHLARMARMRARPERATRLLGAAEALREAIGFVIPPSDHADHDAQVLALRTALGEGAFAAAWAAGRAMPVDEAVADALRAGEAGEADEEPAAAGPRSATPRGADAALPDRLTAREAAVLRLIAAGHTNREIAEQFVLSGATVERHISNLYAKIGARGRADATAYALRQGLA